MEEKKAECLDSEAKAVREQIVSLTRFGAKSAKRERTGRRACGTRRRGDGRISRQVLLSRLRPENHIYTEEEASPSSHDRGPSRVT